MSSERVHSLVAITRRAAFRASRSRSAVRACVPDPGQGAGDHVRQHDDPKTRRLRVQHLRCRDGDQSVDQHERVARERGHRARHVLPAAFCDEHHPDVEAPCSQRLADAPVVDVAAADALVIVDAVGHEEMHGRVRHPIHNFRS